MKIVQTGIVFILLGSRLAASESKIKPIDKWSFVRELTRFLERGGSADEIYEHGLTFLHISAQQGFKRACEILLNKGANLHQADPQGRTALHWAAQMGHQDVCQILLKHGASLYVTDDQEMTPMMLASKHESYPLYRLFMKPTIGKEEQVPPFEGKSTALERLFNAIAQEDIERCKLLLRIANQANTVGITPLHRAVQTGSEEICGLLLEAGALVNAKDINGFTALHWAALKGDSVLCELLLSHGASRISENALGLTPLDYAIFQGHIEICLILLSDKDKEQVRKTGLTSLHFAAASGSIKLCELFLCHKIEINTQDAYGCTPLHCAAIEGKGTVCAFLLDKMADIEQTDKRNYAALDYALKYNREQMALDLFTCGARLYRDRQKKCLHKALDKEHTRWAKCLLANNWDVNEEHCYNDRDEHVYTPLGVAAARGAIQLCKLLLRKGAEVNPAGAGVLPLYQACRNGHFEVAKLLVECGAKIRLGFRDTGLTPLHGAAEYGDTKILAFLLNKGAPVNVRAGFEQQTPLHVAAENGHLEAAKLLINHGASVSRKTIGTNHSSLEYAAKGHSSLEYATKGGNIEVCKLFLRLGEPVNQRSHGKSPLDVAAEAGNTGICALLVHWGAPVNKKGFNSVIFEAIDNRRAQTCRFLLFHGAYLHEKRRVVSYIWGESTIKITDTPLMLAAKRGDKEFCRILIGKALWCSFGPFGKEARTTGNKVVSFFSKPNQLYLRLYDLLYCLSSPFHPRVPKDVFYFILDKVFEEDHELRDYFLLMLKEAACKGKQIPNKYLPHIVQLVTKDIQQKLTPLMIEAGEHIGEYVLRNNPVSPLVSKLLDPGNLEECFGEQMRESVGRKLKMLQKKAIERIVRAKHKKDAE